jgi:hypothetical protein
MQHAADSLITYLYGGAAIDYKTRQALAAIEDPFERIVETCNRMGVPADEPPVLVIRSYLLLKDLIGRRLTMLNPNVLAQLETVDDPAEWLSALCDLMGVPAPPT